MITESDIIASILTHEGGYVDHPSDKGGPTNFGITASTWGMEKRLGRIATREEVQAITKDDARDFYTRRHIDQSPYRTVAYEPLRAQLIDFGINSGTGRATRWLQRAIGVPVTGLIDDLTLACLHAYPGHLVNNALVAARLKMVDDWTDGDQGQKVFEEGVESRALSFFLVATEDVK